MRRFVKAIADTGNWINKHRKEAEAIQAKRVGLPPEEVSSFYSPPNGIMTAEETQIWIDILTRYGDIKPGKIAAAEVFTNEFNPYYKPGKKR